MIDFVRIYYWDKQKLENFTISEQRFQDIDCVLGYHTGEVKYPYWVRIGNIEIRITEKVGYVFGSLHKFFNSMTIGEEQNYNDFTYSNLLEVIDYLSSRIIDFENTTLTQLEVGLNLELDISPKKFLEKHVLFHHLKGINLDKNYKGGGKMLQYDYSEYYVKIYDKGRMYNISKNILRFEVKFIKKRPLQELDLFTISDLRREDVLEKLFSTLLKRFDEMLILDDYTKKKIDSEDLIELQKYTSQRFWMVDIKSKSRTTKSNQIKKLNNLIDKYHLGNYKASLRKQLIEKYTEFRNN